MDASAFASQAGTAVASAGTSLSNAAMKTMTKIAEARSRKVSQQLLKSHCEELNKEMVNSVDKIVDKLNINDQSEIIEKVADNYFDNDLTEMLKNEITSSLTNSVRKNLRNQLYDHYKKDFKVEQDALEKQEEGIEGGGGPDEISTKVAAAGAGDDNYSVDVDTETSSNSNSSSTSSSGDEAAMMNELVTKVNQQILMDDDLIDDFKKGIVENIASGAFKNALQREVINRLEPMIEKTMESKLNEIFEDMDFKNTAMEVIKGQQRLYDSRTKRKTRGGKKDTINKKDMSNKRRTRRHRKKST